MQFEQQKNGQSTKLLKTAEGSFELETPRDRNSSFEPQIIGKRETILAESSEKKISEMYRVGMTLRNISQHIKSYTIPRLPLPLYTKLRVKLPQKSSNGKVLIWYLYIPSLG